MAYFVNAFLEVDYTPRDMPELQKCGNCFESRTEAIRFQKDIQKLLKEYENTKRNKE